jgi:hypothetical protein
MSLLSEKLYYIPPLILIIISIFLYCGYTIIVP